MARAPKTLTREQLAGRKEKAVQFTLNVLGDADRADEIADESLEDYAARRRIQLENPERKRTMARKTIEDYKDQVRDLKAQLDDLQDDYDELQQENESLQDQVDQVADIVAPADEDEDAGDEGDEDSDQDADYQD